MYEPHEDSYLLVEQVKKFVFGKVLDMGSGSGILAEAALEKTKDVLAVDVNKEVIVYLKKKRINVKYSDLFSNVREKFDWIIFNPPYLPTEKNEQPDFETTSGPRGNEIIEKFLQQAASHLKPKGKILLLTSSFTKEIPKLFKTYNFEYQKTAEKKLFFEVLSVYCLSKE